MSAPTSTQNLVGRGTTSRQIAEELDISDETASVHVSKILAQARDVQPR